MILVSLRFFTFTSLAQGHLKALNYLSFCSFLDVHESCAAQTVLNLSAPTSSSSSVGLFRFPGSKSSQVYIIFLVPTQILGVTPSADSFHMDTSSSNMPPTQLTQHFRRSLLVYQCPVYFRKQTFFLLFFCFQCSTLLTRHPRNSRSISSGALRTVYFKQQWRCPWCNGYHRRKWTRRHEFKSGRDW